MTVAMEQHETWLAARTRLEAGNNKVRTEKTVTLKTVVRGQTAQVVRISPDVPLPSAAIPRRLPRAGDRAVALTAPTISKAESIVRYVAQKHHVSFDAMKSPQRGTEIIRARHEAYYRLRMEAAMSSPEISRFFGGKDRTAVMYGARMHGKRVGRPLA